MPLGPFLRIKSNIRAGVFPASQTFSLPRYHKHHPRLVFGRVQRSCMATGQLEGLCRP